MESQAEYPRQTLGERRVRASFNPSKVGMVDLIKEKTAELINLCEELKDKDPRAASIAQTEYEGACHWAVKAATSPERRQQHSRAQ